MFHRLAGSRLRPSAAFACSRTTPGTSDGSRISAKVGPKITSPIGTDRALRINYWARMLVCLGGPGSSMWRNHTGPVATLATVLAVVWAAAAGAGEIRGRLLSGGRPAAGVTVAAIPEEPPADEARRLARGGDP